MEENYGGNRLPIKKFPCKSIFHIKMRSSSLKTFTAELKKTCINYSRAQSLFSTNRPFSYSKKEPESNDVMMHFEESLDVDNSD